MEFLVLRNSVCNFWTQLSEPKNIHEEKNIKNINIIVKSMDFTLHSESKTYLIRRTHIHIHFMRISN